MSIKRKPKHIEGLTLRRISELKSKNAKEVYNIAELGEDDSDRLRVSYVVDQGSISDLAVQYETLIDGKWLPVVRYDMAHGYFHRDIYSGTDQVEKKPIPARDFQEALTYAKNDLKEGWEQYKKMYIRSTKKKGRKQ